MTKLVTLLGRKPESGNANQSAALPPAIPLAVANIAPPPVNTAPSEADIELDDELFFPLAAQLGQENEAVRSLLMEAEHKIGDLETIKVSIAKLVDPVCNTLRGYEETKSEKLILQRALNNTREACNKLRDDLGAAEKKAAAFKTEYTRLQEIVTVAKQSLAALERTKAEQLAELDVHRAHVAELQRLVQQQASDLRLTRDENRRIGERIAAADQRTVQLEGQAQTAQQEARQANQERASLQASLDKSLGELAQTARRLSDADKALTSAQDRLKAMEANLAEVQAERSRLSSALDEASHQYRDKMNLLNSRFEAVQARANLTDDLLDEARQALMARADEIRTFERRVVEASMAHDVIAEKLSCVEAVLAQRETQIKDLEHARMVLTEQAHKLVLAATERESAYEAAQQKIVEQSDLVEMLEQQLSAARSSQEMQIENLKAQLQREQLDRSMVEGALEAARKDMSRLLDDVSALRGRSLPENTMQDVLQQAA